MMADVQVAPTQEASQPRQIPQRTAALQIAPSSAVSLPPPPSSASRIRHSHLALDTFSPVNQNGSFEFDRVLKSGYVQKRTRKTKTWKPIFLVLRPNSLSIYKDQNEDKLRQKIHLSDLTAVAFLKDPKHKRQNVFGLFSPSRNYHLEAASRKDAEQWVELIRQEARIEEEEEEMLLASPGSNPTGFERAMRFRNEQRHLQEERFGSSSPEPMDPIPKLSRNQATLAASRRLSHTIEYSGNELASHSDMSDGDMMRAAGASSLSIPEESLAVQPPATRSMMGARNASQMSGFNLEMDPERVVWQGYLLYLKMKGGVRQWKDLWAVIRPRNIALYKNDSEYSPILLIPLSTVINAVEIDPVSRTKRHCLQVITEEKSYKFCAHDEDTLDKSLGAVKSLLAKRKEGVVLALVLAHVDERIMLFETLTLPMLGGQCWPLLAHAFQEGPRLRRILLMDRTSKLNQSLSDNTNPIKLEIKELTTSHGGLGLITEENISTAEDIIYKKPMLLIADDNHLKTTCDNCFQWLGSEIDTNNPFTTAQQSKPTLLKCGGCKVVWYCSKSCQQKAWKHHHKPECKIFVQQEKIDVILRATVRLLLNRRVGIIDDKEWSALTGLLSHIERYMEQGDMLQQALLETEKWNGWSEADVVFKETYCRIKLNCITILTLENEGLGIGLDPLASMINHSCEPNAYCFFEGPRCRIRSLQSIAAGEEITISYINNNAPIYARQIILKYQWFFTCICQKCTSAASNNPPNIPEGYTTDSLSLLDRLATRTDSSQHPENTESAIQQIISDISSSSERWPSHIQPLPILHSQLADGYYRQRNFGKEAYYLLHVCFVSDPVLFPSRVHPSRVRNLFMLTLALKQLAKNGSTAVPEIPLKDFELGLVYKYCMLKVVGDAKVGFGPDSELWKTLNRTLIEEAGMVGEPKAIIARMMTGQFQEDFHELLKRLLAWAVLILLARVC
ncbi:hypothetical protein G7Y89_g11979 [Cudoniella acicularis]|uniref:Suppressor of anucleate metulae protein B n=1 Tax=Cudoniella acicularis TaxID=354080 RepID=A0A8H4VXH3_9HELO|nr:hypothetical protein G7Y89_g11979 [Cudoniella acicularis]